MGRVCMGRLGNGAEFAMGRVCYGPRCPVTFWNKTCFQISEKTLTEFSMAVDSKKNILNLQIRWICDSLIQCYIVKIGSIHYSARRRRLR